MWLKAEHHFAAVTGARAQGTDLKINVLGELYLVSSIWGDDQRRYTGIHGFNLAGQVKPCTGVNLDWVEWSMLVENFTAVKDALKGADVDLSQCKRSFDFEDNIKMYGGKWFVDGRCVDNLPPVLYYSEEDAVKALDNVKPVKGVDYPEKGPDPELRMECVSKPEPDTSLLMNLILVHVVNCKILQLTKKNCEACQIGSDSQIDHCKPGNCLDETMDRIDVYYKQAKESVQVNELMYVFDEVRRLIGVRPVFSRLIAKCAIVWISDDQIISQMPTIAGDHFLAPLMDVIHRAYRNKIVQ